MEIVYLGVTRQNTKKERIKIEKRDENENASKNKVTLYYIDNKKWYWYHIVLVHFIIID